MVTFLFAHWLWISSAIGLLGGYVTLRLYLGQKLSAAAVGVIVVGIIYYIGRKNGVADYEKIAIDIQEKREAEYEKIKSRNTSAADVSDRLRNGSF